MTDDDIPTLAELSGGLLEAPLLERLFADLAAEAEILAILCKGGARDRGTGVAPNLAEARALLTAGTVRGVQIRYRWQQAEWWDTLMCTPEGIRLVRMRQDVC